MKKRQLFLSSLLLFGLVSCGGGESGIVCPVIPVPSSSSEPIPEESPLTLYEENSIVVGNSYGDGSCLALPTYRHKNHGEVPYVSLSRLLGFLKMETLKEPTVEKIGEHLFAVKRNNVFGMLLDVKENRMEILHLDVILDALLKRNNGVEFDTASANPAKDSLVHASDKTLVHGEYAPEVYDLNEYNMDLVEKEDGVYVPFQLFANLILRNVGADLIYNGHDYFFSTLTGVSEPGCYTSNDTFRFNKLLHVPTSAPYLLEGEAKRYVALNASASEEGKKYSILALKENGEGAYFTASSADAEIPSNPAGLLDWRTLEGDTLIGLRLLKPNDQKYAETPSYFRVRHDTCLFNSKRRSREVAEFNYDLLRFQFDNLYGLKEDLKEKKGYVDFDSFVTEKGLKNDLLSLDSLTYDEALADFTMRFIDDGHTSYTGRSIYSGMEEKSVDQMVEQHLGPRMNHLKTAVGNYRELRKEVTGLDNPVGVFMEGHTAVIRFDSFMHLYTYITPLPEEAHDYPMDLIMSASTPYAFLLSFEQIDQNPDIDNVVLDLTCNGGGMILTLPFLAAFFTHDPTFWQYDVSMDVTREFHYSVDLNANGIFGEEEDTYEGKYNFYVLTSDFSFSCASALPCMAHDAGVKLIGKRSGGGACSVGTYVDGSGSIYNTSSPLQIGYLDEDGNFTHDDDGVPVDYELSEDSWYDLKKLDAFVSGLKN